MSAREIRTSIESIIQNTSDEVVLEAYYQILLNLVQVQNRAIVAYDVEERPLTQEQLKKSVSAASQRISEGKVISHDKAKKQSENW